MEGRGGKGREKEGERGKVGKEEEGGRKGRGRERGREGMTRLPILQCWQLCPLEWTNNQSLTRLTTHKKNRRRYHNVRLYISISRL